jgi:hypothetical protein
VSATDSPPEEPETEKEESISDALWTAVPRGKRRKAVPGSSNRATAAIVQKQPRPKVKSISSEATASATRAALAAEAVARRVGRKPGRYDHITVDMLSDNGFLDMPIQVWCGCIPLLPRVVMQSSQPTSSLAS